MTMGNSDDENGEICLTENTREEMQEWLDGGREFSPVPLVKEQDVEELPLW